MDNISININIGEIQSIIGKLSFKLIIESNKQGLIQVYASDPTDMRKSGVLLQLDEKRYLELKQIIQNIDSTIEKLEQNQQMDKLVSRRY